MLVGRGDEIPVSDNHWAGVLHFVVGIALGDWSQGQIDQYLLTFFMEDYPANEGVFMRFALYLYPFQLPADECFASS